MFLRKCWLVSQLSHHNTIVTHTVGVKRMSPVDTELLFIILYSIIALHRNTNIFFLWKSSNLNK